MGLWSYLKGDGWTTTRETNTTPPTIDVRTDVATFKARYAEPSPQVPRRSAEQDLLQRTPAEEAYYQNWLAQHTTGAGQTVVPIDEPRRAMDTQVWREQQVERTARLDALHDKTQAGLEQLHALTVQAQTWRTQHTERGQPSHHEQTLADQIRAHPGEVRRWQEDRQQGRER